MDVKYFALEAISGTFPNISLTFETWILSETLFHSPLYCFFRSLHSSCLGLTDFLTTSSEKLTTQDLLHYIYCSFWMIKYRLCILVYSQRYWMIKGWIFYQGLPQILLVQLSSAFLYNLRIALRKHHPMSHSSAIVSELVHACFSMQFAFLRPELILPVADGSKCLFICFCRFASTQHIVYMCSLSRGGKKISCAHTV